MRTLALFAAAGLAAAACGGNSEPEGRPDSGPVDPLAVCEDTEGGDPFNIALGPVLAEGDEFAEFEDGAEVVLELGFQGFYMLQLETRAAPLAIPSERICFSCATRLVTVPGTTEWDGMTQELAIDYVEQASGDFAAPVTLIVGTSDDGDDLAGAEVVISLTCEGHGFSGAAVDRTLRLTL